MFQQTRLSDHSAIGTPGDLPSVIATWGSAPALLADLTGQAPKELGFDGTGYWPVIVTPANFDATKQILTGGVVLGAVDTADKQWAATQAVRDLTAAELATNLAAAQQAQIAALSASCSAQIIGGFASSGLGSSYTYPSGLTDQANLSASVLASLMPNNPAGWTTQFLCASAAGTWAFVAHTAVQIQQVGEDGKTAVLNARVRLATLSAEIAAATTAAAVTAITW